MLAEGKTINGVDYDEKLRDGHYKTELTSEINEKLKTVTHTPKDKWSIPQTSNQEIGWLADVDKILFRNASRREVSSFIGERDVLRLTMLTVTTQ